MKKESAAVADVLWEDEALIVFDKPSGLLVAPDRWDKEKVNLMDWIHEKVSPDYFNANRIDKDTSGLVICAKTKPALDNLCRQFEDRQVEKEYLALVRGTPPTAQGMIDRRLAPDSAMPGRMRVASSGKPAQTGYRLEKSWRFCSLLRVFPRTGRQHQIRVHLTFLGCRIIGDAMYAKDTGLFMSEFKSGYKQKDHRPEIPLIGRLALHASVLRLTHPVTGAPLEITAPRPDDFELALKCLDRYADQPA